MFGYIIIGKQQSFSVSRIQTEKNSYTDTELLVSSQRSGSTCLFGERLILCQFHHVGPSSETMSFQRHERPITGIRFILMDKFSCIPTCPTLCLSVCRRKETNKVCPRAQRWIVPSARLYIGSRWRYQHTVGKIVGKMRNKPWISKKKYFPEWLKCFA